jgi:predicted DNA-binding transcriptional regulator AlpA
MADLIEKLNGSALAASVSARAMLAREGEAARRRIGDDGGPPLTEVQAAIRKASVEAATVYLTAAQVRGRYGNVSEMTLWRWLRDEKLNFPRPYRVNKRRLWKAGELTAWERTKAPDRPLRRARAPAAPGR